ncbi:hypothetical protein FNV43_RR07725 [Rhamnella rubrinervis]|uniref:Glabrous enhancer-binding protein-like DBD domain-containing protein n=1 Tax=Rhamnella rubrinervis TaxID=2594499 RepID=A0A8K0HFX1_9ROSA|nr:hypothetical protein FNV43_RR07725 [Rhamnella rubrinervis]
MAPKRPSPLDEPPAASTSDEEEATSVEEEEEEEDSGSESGSEEEEDEPESEQKQPQPKTPAVTPNHASDQKAPSKKPDPAASNNSMPQSSGSALESDSDETGSDSEPENNLRTPGAADPNIKPIASKPMEETPTAKKPRSKSNTTATRLPAKRPSESEAKDSKRAKKKGPERDEEDEPGTAAEDETKKTGDDSKTKLFQRLWSEDDEIVILKGIVDYTAKKGTDPSADMNAFHDFIKKSLHVNVTKSQLVDKIRRLKKKYANNAGKKKFNPTKPHEQKAFDLSKKIWGNEQPSGGVEQPKSNGKAKSSQKGNGRSLALLKAELLSPPETSKEVAKMDIDRNTGVSEMVSFDKSFGLLGLPEHVLKRGLDMIVESKRVELEEKWKKLNLAELELYARRSQLISDQAKLILDAYKSSDH